MDTIKAPRVAVVIGSDSDFPVLKSCIRLLKEFGAEVEVFDCSAHTTLQEAAEYAANAETSGIEVIIAAAGKTAGLPGALTEVTSLPVIGIPIKSPFMDGPDSLLSVVRIPSGIPVATVAIDGAENAALLAVQMLSGAYPELGEKMKEYKKGLSRMVEQKNIELKKKMEEETW